MKDIKTKETINETDFDYYPEEEFAEADFEDSGNERCVYYKGTKYRSTLLEQFYSAREKRKAEEEIYGDVNCTKVNLTEELVYICLPDDYKSCLQLLRA